MQKKEASHLLEEVCRVDGSDEHFEHRAKFPVTLVVESKKIKFEIDCGSAVTLVSEKWLKRTFPNLPLCKTQLKLRSYCKKNFVPRGFVRVNVKDTNGVQILNMYVVHYDRNPLLGREWINQLKSLAKVKGSLREIENVKMIEATSQKRIDNLFKKYSNLFNEELAEIKKFKAHLKLKPDARPIFVKNRTVPFRIAEKVEKELERMVDMGIIEKVDSSRWATPIVPVLKKDGGIRICGDFSVTLNPALVVDEHPLPTIEELFASMSGGTIFSKIDLQQAYLQLAVAEEDRELLTLSTYKGLFRCNRLMYGVHFRQLSGNALWKPF